MSTRAPTRAQLDQQKRETEAHEKLVYEIACDAWDRYQAGDTV